MIQQCITRITHVRPATLFAAAFSFALVAVAQTAHAATDLGSFLCEATNLADALAGLLSLVAVVVFIWGLVRFIAGAGNEEERKRGRQVMIWGIIAIFVMVSFWALVTFLQNSVFSSPPGDINTVFTDPCDLF